MLCALEEETPSFLTRDFLVACAEVRVYWKDSSPENMDPLKKLASAVFVNALKDAQEGCQEARLWLLEDDSSFPVWCRAYGVSPTIARQELRKAIRTAPVTRRRRRELVLQALREHPELSNRKIARSLGCSYATVGQIRKRMPQAH